MGYFKAAGPMILAAFTLSACMGGSSDSGPTSRTVSGVNALNAGSFNGDASSNGLAFAGDAEIEPEVLTVRFARLVIDETGQARVDITENTIVRDGTGFQLQMDGETLDFTPAGDFFRATASNGSIYELGAREFVDENVQRISLDVIDADPGELNSWSRTMYGNQTNPDDLPDTGRFFFAGVMDVTYIVTDLDGTNPTDTDDARLVMTVSGNFNGSVNGNVSTTESGPFVVDGEDTLITLRFDETTMEGNGFGTTLQRIECPSESCGGNSQIGGVLHGEDYESLGGVFVLDEFETDEGVRIMGVANYNFLVPS